MSSFTDELFPNDLPLRAAHSLMRLVEGNKRFANGLISVHTIAKSMKLKEHAKGQSPFCIVLTCSDSRIPVETLFDCGIGEVFVVRVAGNVVSPDVIATIEYAAMQFSSALCVVMGHTSCGAVAAAVEQSLNPSVAASPNLKQLIKKILPAVEISKAEIPNGNREALEQHSVLQNVKLSAESIIQNSELIQRLIQTESLAVVNALYDLHSGAVRFGLVTSHASTAPRKLGTSEKEKISVG